MKFSRRSPEALLPLTLAVLFTAAVPVCGQDVARKMGRPPPTGAVEMACQGRVAGWALSGDASPATMSVRVQLDDQPPITTRATLPLAGRPEFGEIACGFDLDLSGMPGVSDAGLRRARLRVWVVDPTLPALDGGEILIHDRIRDLAKPAPAGVTLRPKVVLLINDPPFQSQGGRTLSQVMGWKDPRRLADELVARIKELTRGAVDYQIVDPPITLPVAFRMITGPDGEPDPAGEARYVELARKHATLLEEFRRGLVDAERVREFERTATAEARAFDYDDMIGLLQVALGRADYEGSCEVWIWRMPFSSMPKALMFGPGQYRLGWQSAGSNFELDSKFVAMCFDYGQSLDDALHAYAHRVEGILANALPEDEFKTFATYDKVRRGAAGAGLLHCPPNSGVLDPEPLHRSAMLTPPADYDVASLEYVDFDPSRWSGASTAGPRRVNRDEWGGPAYWNNHLAWLLAQVPGGGGGAPNWWQVVVDPNSSIR